MFELVCMIFQRVPWLMLYMLNFFLISFSYAFFHEMINKISWKIWTTKLGLNMKRKGKKTSLALLPAGSFNIGPWPVPTHGTGWSLCHTSRTVNRIGIRPIFELMQKYQKISWKVEVMVLADSVPVYQHNVHTKQQKFVFVMSHHNKAIVFTNFVIDLTKTAHLVTGEVLFA